MMSKVGYGEDSFSQATVKYEIIAETTDGRYVVRRPNHSLMLIKKGSIQDIHEEVKVEAKKCDDCGAYYEPTLRSAYYLIRGGVGSFYSLEGHLDLCNKCWNKMLREICNDLEVKNGK